VANPHLMAETDAEVVRRGISFVRDLAEKTGLPLEFATAPAHLAPVIDSGGLDLPLLPIRRQLVPPWEQAVRLPGIASRLADADSNKQGA
jgi:hypothetical protein